MPTTGTRRRRFLAAPERFEMTRLLPPEPRPAVPFAFSGAHDETFGAPGIDRRTQESRDAP